MTSTAKFLGEQRPEPQHPSSDRFIGDVQPALRKQIFDIAEAEREADVEPNGVPDDRRRKLMAGERDRHAPSYPTTATRYRCRDNTLERLWGDKSRLRGADPGLPCSAQGGRGLDTIELGLRSRPHDRLRRSDHDPEHAQRPSHPSPRWA